MSSKRDSGSNKFFTIQFSENGGEDTKTTKVPARKGKSLKETVEPILLNHDLSFDTHSIFLESSKTPLPLTSETFLYGGSTLYIRASGTIDVDERVISMRMVDNNKPTNSRKRFTNLLVDYQINGLDLSDHVDGHVDSLKESDSFDEDEFFLENSWKEIITPPEDMTDRQRVQQEAIWELFSTEVIYIKDIKVVIDIFRKCFIALQKENYLQEVDEKLIYANILEIYEVNVAFWKLLKQVTEKARITAQLIKPAQLIESFDEFEELFQPYITYCNSDPSSMKLPTYSPETSDMLKEYFAWCDNHESCKRIHLTGFLIKPLQRVTKYSLLIRAILSKTDDENEKAVLEDMMSRVETFVSKINSAVHMRQEYEKLISILAKFDTYNPVEAVNDEVEKVMSEYTKLDLTGSIPGLLEHEKRFILKEGPMKIVEKQVKKDTYAFLFSDVFVLTKIKRNIDKYRVIRQPFRINKVVLRVLKDPGSFLFIYLNEYDVLTNSFILQINPNEQAKWFAAFEKAKNDYETLRLEYAITKENFLDDELPNSLISKNRLRNRAANSKAKPVVRSISRKDVTKKPLHDWTNTKIMIGATIFCLVNIFLSRLFGYK